MQNQRLVTNSQVSGVVSTNAENVVCCSPTVLRNFNQSLHFNYSLPNLKLRCISPCPVMEKKVGKDCTKSVSIVVSPSTKKFADLPPGSLTDEELWKYFQQVTVLDRCKCEAFACRHVDHAKEDLILLAEQDADTQANNFGGKTRAIKNEAELSDEFNVDQRTFLSPAVDRRLIDPVASTLDEMQMVVQFEDPSKIFADCVNLPATTANAKLCPRSLTYRQFCQKLATPSGDEGLSQYLRVEQKTLNEILSQCIICVGCRRSVEKLYGELMENGHSALYPLVVNKDSSLTLHHSFLLDPRALFKLLTFDGLKIKSTLEMLTKCRKNKRCNLHSLDVHVPKLKNRWDDFWDLMSEDCRDECCVVETEHLMEMLESYLQKHKFCADCRTKIMKAYHLLTGEADKSKEVGYNPKLYEGLKYCSTEFHLHLKPCPEYLNLLMDRAEPELLGGFKERHAKTLDIAQGEVLTCLGLYIYDRLHRLSNAMKTLQNTFQLLYCVGIMAVDTAFQKSTESKSISSADNLDKICAELQNSTANPIKLKAANKKFKPKSCCASRSNHGTKCFKNCKKSMATNQPCSKCLADSPPSTPCRPYFSRSLSPPADRRLSSTAGQLVVSGGVERRNRFAAVADDHAERPSSVLGVAHISSAKSTKVVVETTPSPPATTGGLADDAGYASSLSTHPLDHKSAVSSDALSIGSDRSEFDFPFEIGCPPGSVKCCQLANHNFHQCGSLVEMLNENRACNDDGIDSCDEMDEGYGISKEDIEWFHKNRSIICQERVKLRQDLIAKFKIMQIRLAASLN